MKNEETKAKKAVTSTKKVDSKTTKKATSKTQTTKAEKEPKKTTKKVSLTKAKKTSTTKSKKSTSKVSVMEYYDLPYRYNQTIIKILAQTPNMLFVYWDISDDDRANFINNYGDDFFSKTKPVLIVHNETMDYYFELEINDFANSWYLQVNDANCTYDIELGRRPLSYVDEIKENYIYVSSSNKLEIPNNHVLFENFNPNVTYKNVKDNKITKKDFSKSLPYSLYQNLYMDKKIFRDLLDGKFTNFSSSTSF